MIRRVLDRHKKQRSSAWRPERQSLSDCNSRFDRNRPPSRISNGGLICPVQDRKRDQRAFGFFQEDKIVCLNTVHRNHVSQAYLLGGKQIRDWVNESALDGAFQVARSVFQIRTFAKQKLPSGWHHAGIGNVP